MILQALSSISLAMVLTLFPVAHQILMESMQKLNHLQLLVATSESARNLSKNTFDFEYHKMIIWIEVTGGELYQMPFGSLITSVCNS